MSQPPVPPPPPGYGFGYVPLGSAQGYPPNNEERTWAALVHGSYFVLGIVAPIVVMLTKGKESPFVRRAAVEALNFHLSILIYSLASGVLIIVLVGLVTLFATLVFGVVAAILGIVAGSQGRDYRYPLCIRMVS